MVVAGNRRCSSTAVAAVWGNTSSVPQFRVLLSSCIPCSGSFVFIVAVMLVSPLFIIPSDVFFILPAFFSLFKDSGDYLVSTPGNKDTADQNSSCNGRMYHCMCIDMFTFWKKRRAMKGGKKRKKEKGDDEKKRTVFEKDHVSLLAAAQGSVNPGQSYISSNSFLQLTIQYVYWLLSVKARQEMLLLFLLTTR